LKGAARGRQELKNDEDENYNVGGIGPRREVNRIGEVAGQRSVLSVSPSRMITSL
jgi:hypothetical protein